MPATLNPRSTTRPTVPAPSLSFPPAPRFVPAPPHPPSDELPTWRPSALAAFAFVDVVPSSSLTSTHAWIGYFVVLAVVAASMFAAGWTARGSR